MIFQRNHSIGFCVVVATALATSSCSHSASTAPQAGSAAAGGETAGGVGASGTAAGTAATAGAAGTAGDAAGAAAIGGSAAGASGTIGSGGSSGGGAGSQAVPAIETVYVSGYGSDITVFDFDTKTGMSTKRSSTNGGTSPSYMAFAPNLKFAYAINEADGANSKVVAFSIEAQTGKLTQLNSSVTGGNGSPHLAVHPSGKWIAVAHYNSGQTSVLPLDATGKVGTAGPLDKGPNGGCENAHQAVFDRSGDHLLVPCLGSNYVIQFKFKDGVLSYNDPATVAVMGGPRHLAFDPEQKHAFVLSETESLITSFKYDSTTGQLSDPQSINSYDQMKGSSAQVVVHPSGKWLYASNRTENSIGLFSIDTASRPHPVSFIKDMIATPRDFSIDPSGQWLISANQDGAQNVLVFRIDTADGHLTRMSVVPVGSQPTFTQAIVLP
jgi:6-phosphogluconolactonase